MAESAPTGEKIQRRILYRVSDMCTDIDTFELYINARLSGGGCAQLCQQIKCYGLRQNVYDYVFTQHDTYHIPAQLPHQMLIWPHILSGSENCSHCRHAKLCVDCTDYFRMDRLSISQHLPQNFESMNQLSSQLIQFIKHLASLPSTPEIRIVEQYVQTTRAIIFPGKCTKAARRDVRESIDSFVN
jgi:hypothetical protein